MVREIRLRPNISERDFYTDYKACQRLLEQGNKVKITVLFRGQELELHWERGRQRLEWLIGALASLALPEREPQTLGNRLWVILVPKRPLGTESVGVHAKLPRSPVLTRS